MKRENLGLTPSMEDYIEMIYRLSLNSNSIHINEISKALNIQPPSANKMVKKLFKLNLLTYEKYGSINLTDEGIVLGKFLIERHELLSSFLRFLNLKEEFILDETEKIEHTLSIETLEHIKNFLLFTKKNPQIFNEYLNFLKDKV